MCSGVPCAMDSAWLICLFLASRSASRFCIEGSLCDFLKHGPSIMDGSVITGFRKTASGLLIVMNGYAGGCSCREPSTEQEGGL